MKALIEIGGDWQDTYVTAYIHSKYKDEKLPNRINFEAISEDGFDCILNLAPSCDGINLRTANAPDHEERSFLFVNVNSPWKVFDESLVWSNVELEVSRSHSLVGWVIFCTLSLVRKVRHIFQ